MKWLWGLAGLTLLAIACGGCGPTSYGSIVFSQEPAGDYKWSSTTERNTHTEATQDALTSCRRQGGTNCTEVAWFVNECAALYRVDTNGYAAAVASTAQEALDDAFAKCGTVGKHCTAEVAACTGDAYPPNSVWNYSVERAEAARQGQLTQTRQLKNALDNLLNRQDSCNTRGG